MVQALTGVNDGSFTRLEVLENGAMKNVLDLLGDVTYDDVPLTAAVLANTTSTAVNSANIAVHGSTLTQHATAIAGKEPSIGTGGLTIAQTSGLQSALDLKLAADKLPQLKYQGGYIDMAKLEFSDSVLSLGSGAGEYLIQSTPMMSSVQGLASAMTQHEAA